MKGIFVCLFVFCVSVSSAQQPPPPPSDTVHVRRVFKFRGTLAPSPPAPIIGAVTLRFSMYDQPDGGAAYWQETQSVHPGAQGSYTVLLGETTPGGLPSRAFAASEDHWLGVQLSGNPEQPRILLVELPPTAAADSGTSAAHIKQKRQPIECHGTPHDRTSLDHVSCGLTAGLQRDPQMVESANRTLRSAAVRQTAEIHALARQNLRCNP